MIRFCTILAIFLLGTTMLTSPETTAQKDLLKRADENYELVFTRPEEAFQKAAIIMQEAQKEKNQEAELCAISTQCVYYKSKNNFEELMITAKLLFQKATSYKHPVYQTSAKIELFNAYAFNGLHVKAFEELKQGEKIISRVKNKDFITIHTRANLFIAFSNYYFLQKDYNNQLKYLKLTAHEYEKFTDEKYKEKYRYIDYSNRGGVYTDLNNLDSAEYYAKLSISNENGYGRDDIQFFNFSVLGRVAMKKADYKNAVIYFKEAEKVKGYKNHLNILELYDKVIQAYSMLNDNKKVRKYEAKRDSVKLNISENQNKSLQHLLQESVKNGKKTAYNYSFIILIILTIITITLFSLKKFKKTTPHENQINETNKNQEKQELSKLLEMFKKNDLAFMTLFNEVFPDFSRKLIEINPTLVQSEIEFCALIKLKIQTKDIARYRYLAHRTIQNKKYLIRKKLNIPKGVDIYQYFNDL